MSITRKGLQRPKLKLETVLKNFPFDKPRDIQVDAIKQVIDSYNRGMEYVFLEVPVGGGKSGIALAIARSLQDAFIVTLTEQLQNQYMKDFAHHGLKVLKGRGKYTCEGCGGSCALGRTLKLKCKDCPYQTAKVLALGSRFMVCNYHSFLSNVGGPAGAPLLESWRQTGGLPEPEDDASLVLPRACAVWDEAHTIEAFLLDQKGLDVNMNSLAVNAGPLPDSETDPLPYFEYLQDKLIPKVLEEIKHTADPKEVERLELFVTTASAALARAEIDDWIPERPKERDNSLDPFRFSLKPLQVAAYGHELWGWADFNIFMSGTILSPWQMVKALGLDAEKGDHIVMPSPFPVENRLIYTAELDMTYKARDESWPVMANIVDQVMTRHAKEKGILLCPSNAMIDYILGALSPQNKARVLKASGSTRLSTYQRHLDGDLPTVLAAPGLWEGADLKGDASRFQIIPAVPRAFFQGQVAARAGVDRNWYRWVTYTKLLQGFGRSVRTEDDYAVTYVLDGDFLKEARAGDTMIPPWIRESIREGLNPGKAAPTLSPKLEPKLESEPEPKPKAKTKSKSKSKEKAP
jgi:ATP-dependent DNA helicase DinG